MTLIGFGLHPNCTDVPFTKAFSYNGAQQCCLFFLRFQVLIFSLYLSEASVISEGRKRPKSFTNCSDLVHRDRHCSVLSHSEKDDDDHIEAVNKSKSAVAFQA